jgi:hypothetical protein
MNTSQFVRGSNNEFAALPLSRTWKSIRDYVERWERVEGVCFLAERDDTFLLFNYGGYDFCLHDDEATLHMCVNDVNCPAAILNEVREHFAAFLPAKPWTHIDVPQCLATTNLAPPSGLAP